MKNFACQKAFQDLEMDALMSLWNGENYCEILVHDQYRYHGMQKFALQKAFQDLEMDALMSLWSGNHMSINQEWPVRRLHITPISMNNSYKKKNN